MAHWRSQSGPALSAAEDVDARHSSKTMQHSALVRSPRPPPTGMSPPHQTLFEFASIRFGDFESCLQFMNTQGVELDLRASADRMLWQTYKTFERLIRRDFDARLQPLVQDLANQCVQQYALLDYGADCGYERLRTYLHRLVLSPELLKAAYLEEFMRLPQHERLEFIRRPVASHIEVIRIFCALFDHLYEKTQAEARYKTEQTILNRVQLRLENVQAQLSHRRTISPSEIGRAI
ncbi:hypothetical protein DFH11DRAFT_1544761 [Phellopilus nigrolimitatus]|nr:hypothetical protein DFH11DRAFT_1544761 [Phellopilus nigrolimitatus]